MCLIAIFKHILKKVRRHYVTHLRNVQYVHALIHFLCRHAHNLNYLKGVASGSERNEYGVLNISLDYCPFDRSRCTLICFTIFTRSISCKISHPHVGDSPCLHNNAIKSFATHSFERILRLLFMQTSSSIIHSPMDRHICVRDQGIKNLTEFLKLNLTQLFSTINIFIFLLIEPKMSQREWKVESKQLILSS